MAHRHLDKNGESICFDFSAHDGCEVGDACGFFSHLQKIGPEGLQWDVKSDLARRGGRIGEKRIGALLSEGYVHALRAQIAASWEKT